jgi:hypothetical protein
MSLGAGSKRAPTMAISSGDAASVSNPSSSHGVLRTLMSGMLAGHMVVQITIVGVPDTNLIAEYQHFLHTTFE